MILVLPPNHSSILDAVFRCSITIATSVFGRTHWAATESPPEVRGSRAVLGRASFSTYQRTSASAIITGNTATSGRRCVESSRPVDRSTNQ